MQAARDTEWETEASVEVVPNPKLSPAQQAIVAREWGMTMTRQQWLWPAKMRRALIPYFLEQHHLRRPAARAPVIARNLESLQARSFEDSEG